MNAKTAVVDWSGNYEENCIQLSRHLGKNKIRRKLFNAIYGRRSKARSKKQLMADCGIKDSQQAQNELDNLARCGLILKAANDRIVADQSRNVYSKEPHVRAHRAKILKYADNSALAKNTPTKRNPASRTKIVIVRPLVTRAMLRKKKHLDILYLMANPAKKQSLRVDKEIKEVQSEIRRSNFRDSITLHQSPAANYDDIFRGLNDHSPRIVHFSGHGNSSGVAMDEGSSKKGKTQFISFDLLNRALAATDSPPDVILLNACNSAGARRQLLGTVKAVIGMEDNISDVAAIAFATKFYGAIASGQSLQAAYDQGCAAIAVVSLNETSTPSLSIARGVNAKKLKLT